MLIAAGADRLWYDTFVALGADVILECACECH